MTCPDRPTGACCRLSARIACRRCSSAPSIPNEFLSDFGLRSLSKFHKDHPYVLNIDGQTRMADYEPGESTSGLFGGNSNWRGPVWFPTNYLLIEALQRHSTTTTATAC